eukprot:1159191-Pelagomonas_calceolata.AAC.2
MDGSRQPPRLILVTCSTPLQTLEGIQRSPESNAGQKGCALSRAPFSLWSDYLASQGRCRGTWQCHFKLGSSFFLDLDHVMVGQKGWPAPQAKAPPGVHARPAALGLLKSSKGMRTFRPLLTCRGLQVQLAEASGSAWAAQAFKANAHIQAPSYMQGPADAAS